MAKSLLEPPSCACFNIRRAARKVTQIYDKALRPAGLQATQFTLLAMLAAGNDGNGILMGSLAGRLGMDRTTLTRNLAIAERAKWALVRPGKDRRERHVALTAAGRKKLAQARPYWQAAQQGIIEQLSETGLAELLTLTHRLDSS